MIILNIPIEFSKTTGFRTYDDGPKSGQEFYETLLKKKFTDAINRKERLKIILDGGEGYTSSFLNEAFRLLGKDFGSNKVWDNIIVISAEIPKYIKKIKEAIYES